MVAFTLSKWPVYLSGVEGPAVAKPCSAPQPPGMVGCSACPPVLGFHRHRGLEGGCGDWESGVLVSVVFFLKAGEGIWSSVWGIEVGLIVRPSVHGWCFWTVTID